jgi:arylsulfatase A-like enzyme
LDAASRGRSTAARGHWYAGLLALVAASGLACAGGGEPSFWTIERRVIPDGEAMFDPATIVRSQAVRSWRFERSGDLEPWSAAPAAPGYGIHGGVLALPWGGEPETAIALREPVDPAAFDALAVEVSGLKRGSVSVEWRRPGEPFGADRRVETHRAVRAGESSYRYRLPLFGHPDWRGEQVELRLAFTVNANTTPLLHGVEALREQVDEAALAAALGRVWKASLERDVRNVRLAVPGVPIVEEVEIPAGVVAELAYGVQPGLPSALRFRLSVEVGGETAVVLDERVEPGGSWREARLALGSFAGQRVRLRLETDSEGRPYDPRWGFGLWAGGTLLRPAAEEPPVVVLVSIDTLRADRLSLYGYERETSPHLDAWARERATVFRRAVAAAPWTLPAHVSMFTGLDAHRHGVNHEGGAGPELEMLAESLQRAGFTTAAITGGGFVHPRWGFAQGFDSYLYYRDEAGSREEMKEGIDRALALLEARRDRPLFLFFHTYEVHNPYRARQPFFGRFSDIDPAGYHVRGGRTGVTRAGGWLDVRAFTLLHRGAEVTDEGLPFTTNELANDLYDSGVAYADRQLSRLLGALSTGSIGRRALVVVTSDHGEMLGEHDQVGHVTLYEENLLVPLIVSAPGGRGHGREVEDQARSVDVAPTVLDLLDVEQVPGVDGVSLTPLLDGERGAPRPVAWTYAGASNYGLAASVRGRLKYIFKNQAWTTPAPTEELYDLRADPREQEDLAADGNPRLARFREAARGELDHVGRGLAVELRNLETKSLHGLLRSSAIRIFRVKTATPGCVTLEPKGSDGAEFVLPPGAACRLRIEDVNSRAFAVELWLEGRGGRGRAEIDLAELGEGVRAEPEGGVRAAAPGGPPATGVELRWIGGPSLRGESPADIDQALREQLQALGYLGGP